MSAHLQNKNNDHRSRETCATMSAQVPYETNHITLLRDSKRLSALNFCYEFYCNLKEKALYIRRKKDLKKCFDSIIIILIC